MHVCVWVCFIWTMCDSKCKCMFVYMRPCLYVACCVTLRHGRCFLVFRAVQRRPLRGRGVGEMCGQHARLWGSLALGRAHSPPHFLWWTDGPCSAWLQKTTTIRGEIEGKICLKKIISWKQKFHNKCKHLCKHTDISIQTHALITFIHACACGHCVLSIRKVWECKHTKI